MFTQNCRCKCGCTLAALIAGLILGVITAFLQITGAISLSTLAVGLVFGIALVYLWVLLLTAALSGQRIGGRCGCSALNTLLAGILGTLLLAAVLLAVGIRATSILSAIFVGTLVFFLVLTVAGTACFIRALTDCDGECPFTES